MDKLRFAKLLCLVGLSVLINWAAAGCTGPSTTPAPTVSSPLSPLETPSVEDAGSSPPATTVPLVTLEPESGGATGTVATYPEDWKNEQLYVYFAPFTPSDETGDEGFFVLEPSIHPRVEVQRDGYFQAGDIPPGKYVVVVGPDAQDALPVRQESRPRVFEVNAGETLDLEEIHLER